MNMLKDICSLFKRLRSQTNVYIKLHYNQDQKIMLGWSKVMNISEDVMNTYMMALAAFALHV